MRRANAPDHIGYAVVLSERDTALGADRGPAWVPFSWFEPMWLENLGFAAVGDGWCLTEAGATRLDGEIPWNGSGGVLSSNPIGASGMLRFTEAGCRCAAARASTKSTACVRPSVTPTVGDRSSSRCGRSAAPSPEEVMMRVVVDYDLCESNAVCMGILPEVFEVRDDDFMYVLNEQPPEEYRERLMQAVASCPKQAISVVET